MTKTIIGPAVVRGHFYRPLQVDVGGSDEVLFPEGCRLRAQVRDDLSYDCVIAELTTENGGLRRVDDTTVEMQIEARDTAKARFGSVILDFVRTDVSPEIYLYVQLTIPVLSPATRDALP